MRQTQSLKTQSPQNPDDCYTFTTCPTVWGITVLSKFYGAKFLKIGNLHVSWNNCFHGSFIVGHTPRPDVCAYFNINELNY